MECEQHPNDEFHQLSEMHAKEAYDDTMEKLMLAQIKANRQSELSGELPF